MTTLPVEAIRASFLQALDTPDPIILTAPTGSGKSTRVPLWMAEHLGAPILVVEPRRVACRSLANYLASQAGESVGESVGYAIRFEDRRGPNTQVLFVTPGVALRLLSQETFPFGAVLLDEFHERGWEIDLIATLIRARDDIGPLIVTSATLEVGPLQTRLKARVLESEGRTYPVDISYLGGVPAPSGDRLPERVRRAVQRALDETQGEVLVFLPGKGEISRCASELQGMPVTILPVHASLPHKEMARVFEPARSDRRRVFLATNVAETSITLPGVTCVIDAGLARMNLHRAGRSALLLTPIAQDAMDQRAGRAGRVAPGVCFRLWESSWSPRASTAPEIERVALDDMMLRAASCGLGGRAFDQAPWVTPPPEFAVTKARTRLQKIAALDDRGALTPRGSRLADLPVSAFEAQILLDPPPELAATLADLVAILQRGGSLLRPTHNLSPQKKERVQDARDTLLASCTDEVMEALRCLRHGDPDRHHLRASTLREVRKLAALLRDVVGATPTRPERDDTPLPTGRALAMELLPRIPDAAFVLRKRALKPGKKRSRSTSKPWGNGTIEVLLDPYVAHRPEDRFEENQGPRAGLMLSTTWLGDRRGTGVVGRGNMLLPVTLGDMARAGIGEVEVADVTLEKKTKTIQGRITRTHAGVTLESEARPLEGDALCQAAASLVMEGRLFGGADVVLDRLHLWGVLSHWESTPQTAHWDVTGLGAPPEPEAFLAQRFVELGLTTSEELVMLEPEDLLPDLSGVPDHELEGLLSELPRVWSYQGAVYLCEIRMTARRVTMKPMNKEAKKRQEPPAKVLPRFRGFRVEYQHASRRVTLRG